MSYDPPARVFDRGAGASEDGPEPGTLLPERALSCPFCMASQTDGWLRTGAMYPPMFWGLLGGCLGCTALLVVVSVWILLPSHGWVFVLASIVGIGSLFMGSAAGMWSIFVRTSIRVSAAGIETRAAYGGRSRLHSWSDFRLEPRGNSGFGAMVLPFGTVYLSPPQFHAARAAIPELYASVASDRPRIPGP